MLGHQAALNHSAPPAHTHLHLPPPSPPTLSGTLGRAHEAVERPESRFFAMKTRKKLLFWLRGHLMPPSNGKLAVAAPMGGGGGNDDDDNDDDEGDDEDDDDDNGGKKKRPGK